MRIIGVGFVFGLFLTLRPVPVAGQHQLSAHPHYSSSQRSHRHHEQPQPRSSPYTHSHGHSIVPPHAHGQSQFVQFIPYSGYYQGGHTHVGYTGVSFGRTVGLSIGPRYGYLPFPSQPLQWTPAVPPVTSPPIIVPLAFGPAEPKSKPSSPAARMKSLEFQVRGDQRMRDQKWSEARAAYASAVSAAPDRAEAHLRLGFCFVVIRRFEPAIREFKRAVALDPAVARTGKRLDDLLGPGSQILHNSILSRLSEWANEDIRNPDRLFLLGAVLHFMNDGRGRDYLEAALQMNAGGDQSHLNHFLKPPESPLKEPMAEAPADLPALNNQPAPVTIDPPPIDDVRLRDLPVPLSETPVPMPVGLSVAP